MKEFPAAEDVLIITDDEGQRSWANASNLAMAFVRRGYDVRRVDRDVARAASGSLPVGAYLVSASTEAGADMRGLQLAVSRLQADAEIARRMEGVTLRVGRVSSGLLETPTLRVPRIAVYGAAGAPYHYLDIFAQAGFDVVPVGSHDVRQELLSSFDCFAVPGGGWEHMNGQLGRLGPEGAAAVREFVERGGTYLSSCAGTYNVLSIDSKFEGGWNPAHHELPKLSARSWLTDPKQSWGLRSPGIGVVQAELASADHPLTAGLPPTLDVVYYNGPLLEPTGPGLQPLLICRAPDAKRFTPGEALHRPLEAADVRTWMQQACELGMLGGAFERVGDGWVVGFGLHPEFGPDPDMLAWGQPARLLANAALWAAGNAREGASPAPILPVAESVSETVQVARRACAALDEAFAEQQALPLDPVPDWLAPGRHVRAAFGRDPIQLWTETIRGARRFLHDLDVELARWQDRASGVEADATPDAREAAAASRRLLLGPPLEDGQDLGYKGVPALLEEARTILETLSAGGVSGRFRAVAMSYLSAAGLVVDTQLLVSAANGLLDAQRFAAAVPDAGATISKESMQ